MAGKAAAAAAAAAAEEGPARVPAADTGMPGANQAKT